MKKEEPLATVSGSPRFLSRTPAEPIIGDNRLPTLPPLDERRFQIGAERARGGIGRVLEVTDRLLGRQVALKVPRAQQEPGEVARFVREALITARLQHPAIVPIYDAGLRAGGEPCYSMRLVPGATLHDAISGAEGLEGRLALLPHVQAVADAVAYAHEQGIVHRDLKPANVLVGPFGETVVIDWGLAKDLRDRTGHPDPLPFADSGPGQELTRSGEVMGTPGYMSPEQARGEEADERSDVFAIGAMLYHLLTGGPPYRVNNPAEVLEGPAIPVELREPGAPRDLVAIVDKAMALEPASRYATAQSLAVDLKRFATGQLVGARRYSRWALARRWLIRHRTMAVAAAVVLVALAAGAIGIVRERNRTAAENNRLRLMQAQAVLDTDPTAAAAWLKTYRVEPGREAGAAEVAAHAAAAGVARHVLTLPGETPMRVCLAPSGRLAGVLGREGSIWVFDLQRGSRNRLGTLGGTPADCFFMGGDGAQLVAYAMRGGGVMTARLPDGPARKLPIPGPVNLVRPSADGRLVATSRDGRIHIAALDGAAVQTLTNLPPDLAFTEPAPAGAVLYAADGKGGLWRIPLDGGPPSLAAQLETPVSRIAFSPDGRSMIFASRQDVGVRDLTSGETRWHRTQESPADPINIKPTRDGVVSISGDDFRVSHWNPRTGEDVTLGTRAFFKALAVTQDGQRAAWVDTGGTIHLADLEGKVVRPIARHPTSVRSFSLTPDGQWLAATFGTAARVFALPPATGRRVELDTPRPMLIAVSARNEVVAAEGGQRLVAFDARTGARRPLGDVGEQVKTLTVSPGGQWVAAVGSRGRVVAVDLAAGAMRDVVQTANPDGFANFLDDETLLAPDLKNDLHSWRLRSGEHRRIAHLPDLHTAFAIARPRAGPIRLITTSQNSLTKMIVIDVDTGRLEAEDMLGSSLFRLVPAHDGRRVAIGLGDGRVVLWDLGSKSHRTLGRREGFVSGVAFSPDDRGLFVADETGGMVRYDLAGGPTVEMGRHPARVNFLVASPSGRSLASCDTTGETRLWDPATGALQIWRGGGEPIALQFVGEDRLVSSEAGGMRIVTLARDRLVPTTPTALAGWLEALTTASIAPTGEPVTALR